MLKEHAQRESKKHDDDLATYIFTKIHVNKTIVEILQECIHIKRPMVERLPMAKRGKRE